MRVFPVDLAGHPYYAQAFNAAHHGTDIFAPRGTRVFAVDDGYARQDTDPKGGTVVYLVTDDKTKYYYAHLDKTTGYFPREVKAGDVLGEVGNSGNAATRATHLHFQVSDPVLGTVDPYPLLRGVDEVAPTTTPTSSTPTPKRTPSARSNWNGLVLLGLLWLATRKT